MNNLASYLDFANHKQEATPEDIEKLCQSVREHGFHSAFVNPCYVSLARRLLGENAVVGTVVSFPLGQDTLEDKVASAINSIKNGADELDVSMNVGLFKAGRDSEVLEEMKEIVQRAKEASPKTIIKFIIETGLLADDEIKEASELVVSSGADFVKTNSGLGPRGASLNDVALIKEAIGDKQSLSLRDKVRIKVAGGIETYDQAVSFLKAGAVRIGTSHAPEIVEEVTKASQI